jgi:hypothetical protein
MNLGLIVEGFGEVEAAPLLIRRLVTWLAPHLQLEIARPYRVKRQRIVKEGELERVVDFMSRSIGPGGALLVLLDADYDCPATLGPELLARARKARPDRQIAVILAKQEFEAWFLAALSSLRGVRTISGAVEPPSDPESVAGAKGWLERQMSSGYSETVDQAALTAVMDLVAARRADSFDKLVRDISAILGIACPPRHVS